jgi:dTDP-4-amino-4,6-dideoxygalactose transaminase
MIPVTKTYFPSLDKYHELLKKVWASGWLTNRGELVKTLEANIQAYLKSPGLVVMNNGTIPLQIALKIFGKQGEIITTPFSYVATTSAIVWEGCTPVFVDIDTQSLTIDPALIEAAITPKTTCILATHVFGNICHVEQIEAIANKHNLKVIYDAAHCFGIEYQGRSVFEWGDFSTCSFHATKIFHTGEGGAIFTQDPALLQQAFRMHNFGHVTPETFDGVGINGKISELNGAMGLAILDEMDTILSQRLTIVSRYNANLNFNGYQSLQLREGIKWNASYYPIWFDDPSLFQKVLNQLNQHDIFPRRYFNPSLNQLPYVNGQSCPNSERISQTIICLPLYVGLKEEEIDLICSIINQSA